MRGMTRAMMWTLVALICFASRPVAGGPQGASAVQVDKSSIGGVVVNSNGAKPEAGVWVIAETTDLPTKFAKVVVTDDRGRYLIPDLPKANYSVWVRGYGLVDSPKVQSEPGKVVNLRAVAAPSEAEAAKGYPAIYWYSMMKIPDARVRQQGRQGQGHPREDDPVRVAERVEEPCLRRLPSTRSACHQRSE